MWSSRIFPSPRRLLQQKTERAARAVSSRSRSRASELNERLARRGIDRDFAILNPGAGWGAKRWPAERYGCVARRWPRMACGRFSTAVPAKRIWRARPRLRAKARPGDEVFDHRTDCADAAGEVVHWRRHRPDASGGGVAGSGGGDFRADRSRAQRALRNAQHCVAQSGESNDARAAIRSRTKGCWRSASMQSWTRRAVC